MIKSRDVNNLQVFDGDKHRTRGFPRIIQRVKVTAMLDGQDKLIGFLYLWWLRFYYTKTEEKLQRNAELISNLDLCWQIK